MMTALAAFFALVPMALALERGSEANAPLGRAVIGGLLAGLVTTLFVVPALYSLVVRDRKKSAGRTKGREAEAKRTAAGENETANRARRRKAPVGEIEGEHRRIGCHGEEPGEGVIVPGPDECALDSGERPA